MLRSFLSGTGTTGDGWPWAKELGHTIVKVRAALAPIHLIGAEELALMKPSAIIVNTSRGPVIDEKALHVTLAAHKIFAAGLKWLKKHDLKALEPLCAQVDKGEISKPEQKWFKAMKSLTSDGYWTSKVGMAQTLGYKGASMLAEYPVCREH